MKITLPLVGVALAGFLANPAAAQSEQTLPAGFLNTPGGSGSSFPFNSTSDHKWQWHYDNAQFNATGPIMITNISVRTLPTAGTIASFDFTDVEVTLASSPTEYWSGSHDPIFDNNLNGDATVVRTGQFAGTNVAAQQWMSLDMTTPFMYDPTAGDDFVVQIRKCGTVQSWGQSIDGSSGAAMMNGGNRYGSTSDCNATMSTFANNEYVPLVRIEYTMAGGGPTLSQVGVCGQVGSGLAAANCTANGLVGFAWSQTPGAFVIGGASCVGTTVDIVNPKSIAVVSADAMGNALVLPGAGIPAQGCALITCQAIDLTTCDTSNTLAL